MAPASIMMELVLKEIMTGQKDKSLIRQIWFENRKSYKSILYDSLIALITMGSLFLLQSGLHYLFGKMGKDDNSPGVRVIDNVVTLLAVIIIIGYLLKLIISIYRDIHEEMLVSIKIKDKLFFDKVNKEISSRIKSANIK